MKRAAALGATVLLSMVGVAGCSSSEPDPAIATIPDAVVPTQAPVVNEGALEVTKAPVIPQRTEVTVEDFDNIVEIGVGERIPITGLPEDTTESVIFVGTDKPEVVDVNQRAVGVSTSSVKDPVFIARTPGVAEITVYESSPTKLGQKVQGEFTVHVYGGDELPWGTGTQGLAGYLASGDIRVGDAVKIAEDAGFAVRIVSVDGDSYPMTMDYSENRMNFTVTDGLITGVTIG